MLSPVHTHTRSVMQTHDECSETRELLLKVELILKALYKYKNKGIR